MQFAIYSRYGNAHQEQTLVQLLSALDGRVTTQLYEPLYHRIAKKYNLQLADNQRFTTAANLAPDTVCMISVGGDGTMLDAAALVVGSDIPLVGLSTGRLGFLPELNLEDLLRYTDNLARRQFETEHRTLLQIRGCGDDVLFALNDLCVQKGGSAIAEIIVHINGELLSTYWADGLIVSTPTGSTAYSLSAGGPVVSPQAACFVVAPIAPHNLSVRPIVIPDSATLTVEMHSRSRNIVVGIDSAEYKLPGRTRLTVRKAAQTISFVKLPDINFYQTLREKLLWGIDARHKAP